MEEPVLVLNANFEPINVCDTRRAVGLILADRAILVLNGRGIIHSVNQSIPIPSVIRLMRMVHRPRPTLKMTRREIFRRDNFTCQYCGKRALDLTVDHIVPRHMGGQHTWLNVVTACASCNHHKGGRTLEEVGMKLHHPPSVPPSSVRYIFGRHLESNQEWEQFLSGW